MFKRSIFLVCVCLLGFSCNKDESLIDRMSITDLVDQDFESYDRIGKIETLWEEGCGKDLNERIEEEIPPRILTRGINPPGMHPIAYQVGVVRLGPNCGEYPTLRILMDCEDDNGQTKITRHVVGSSIIFGSAWLTNYGMQVVNTKKDLQMFFCLVPHHPSIWPTAKLDPIESWAVLALWGTGGIDNLGKPYDTVYRFFDNEDSNNINDGVYTFKNYGFTHTAGIYPKYANGVELPGVYQTHDTELAFHRITGSPYSFSTLSVFPDFGFRYGVFSKRPVLLNANAPVDNVYTDDEDKNNINKWGYNVKAHDRSSIDYGFIKGGGNTDFYVTPARW